MCRMQGQPMGSRFSQQDVGLLSEIWVQSMRREFLSAFNTELKQVRREIRSWGPCIRKVVSSL